MSEIEKLLPGYNCGSCGYRQCRDFAAELKNSDDLQKCPFLSRDNFQDNVKKILTLLGEDVHKDEKIIGIIDALEADFTLAPLKDECSCREDIHPFDGSVEVEIGDILRYRPLGCPVTHFAKVIDMIPGAIYTVHLVGPLHRLGNDDFKFKDVGLCMILAFDGKIAKGKIPKVGQTVKFVPEYCMMQKVHSGMVVGVEGRNVRIEAIDLKVW
ncbi:(Fe-S)-binding protein [Methanolobus mangrovi]|uniref:(Fe-S)-binding protein n=1 Tax=Methanolobus mangrovi TaxID=3072977 RepID=A0AA51UF04_9EURY|nr:(Fe-S)-binding protein [Methanolobus mangrovi]WMW22032.1 (Fe-S)-binding protein [Methanolobus mangrovi]